MDNGALFVIMVSMMMTPIQYANNLDTLMHIDTII